MKRSLVCVLALVVLMATVGLSAQQSAAKDEAARDAELAPQSPDAQPEPPALGIHWAKGSVNPNRPAKPGGGGSPLMTWHNGSIMTDSAVEVIYWGTSWTNSSFVGDKITGLATWYQGFSNSNYAKTSDEYTGTNGTVGPLNTYLGDIVDSTAAGSGARTSTILAEVCRKITNPVPNGYYPVYVDLPRGHAGYCAYHSFGTCSGVQVQFAFFWNLDGDPGCDPQDTQTSHSQGLAALANVSAHELSEARSDPSNGGWYDGSGQENGDKCAWTFNVPFVTFSNGTIWKAQGEWSNAAFNAGTGYPNRSGQNGCLDGH